MLSLEEEYNAILPINKVKASFSIEHVILSLFLFDIHGSIGRVELQKKLDLGRGSLRTFISRLKEGLGLIESESTKAHVLTEKGINYVEELKKEFNLIGNLPVIFDQWRIEGAKYNASGRLVTNLTFDQANELEEKEEEFTNIAKNPGAKGSILLFMDREKSLSLLFQKEKYGRIIRDLKKEYANEWVKINEILPLNKGNIILVSFADKEIDAKLAVIAVALEVQKKVKFLK
ncbi:MAG: hypothetical protein ACFFCS_11740 [Candidatus Hodarchaeota archaeon]